MPRKALSDGWSRHDHRSYRRQTPNCLAYIFGASRPVQMWAWVVYWRRGKASGVEDGFNLARHEAANTMQQIEERSPKAARGSEPAQEPVV